MKCNNFRSKNNFSKAGKTSAKIYSFIIDRDEKINELLLKIIQIKIIFIKK